MRPDIHERIFEYCFNHEFCKTFGVLIATHPDIPSSRLERLEGYDVRFKLNIGKRNYSVFYQHKISNYNEKLHGPNRRFYECHEAPYFRFQLTNHQHNILHELSQDCTDVYYSAPIFHERDVLADYADNGTIINNTVKIPLRNMPTVPVNAMKNNKIKDCCHNITYNYDGSEAYLHFDEDSIFDKSPIKITPITIIKREFTKGNILSSDNKGNMDEEMRKKSPAILQ